MTPNDQLTELWELLDNGTHKAWPERLKWYDYQWDWYPLEGRPPPHWAYKGMSGWTTPDLRDAYAIARDHIEGWLVEQDWIIEKWQYGGKVCVEYKYDYRGIHERRFRTLTDAVRYAQDEQETCPDYLGTGHQEESNDGIS